jgi:hypothetical protein
MPCNERQSVPQSKFEAEDSTEMLAEGGKRMSEDEFKFKEGSDVNESLRKIGEGLAVTIGVDPKKVKCKGIRMYFVDEENEILLQSGLFVSGFDINNWESEEE